MKLSVQKMKSISGALEGVSKEIKEKDQPHRSRRRIIIACVFTIVVSVIALCVGLYFGLRKKCDFVQNHVLFVENTGNVVEANVTLTKREECFSFENAAVIYDFSTGFAVYKPTERDGDMSGCLVESFNITEKTSPTDLQPEVRANTILGETAKEEFQVTDIWLNDEALGPKSRDLCVDEEIKFIERVRKEGGMNVEDEEHDDDGNSDLDTNGELEEPTDRRIKRGWIRRVRIRVRIRVRVRVRIGRSRSRWFRG